MLIKIWRRTCNSFNISLSPAVDQAAPWAVSLEGRRQIHLVSLSTTIVVLKGPAYGGHSLLHQSCSKNLYQHIKNVPFRMSFKVWSAFKLFMTRGDRRHFSKSCWHCYDNYIYVKTKRLKMQFLFGEKGIGRRRLRRLSLVGINACVCTYTQMLLLRGSALQNKKYLGPVNMRY